MTEKSVTPTKVRVSGPWQVHHDGKLYYQGEQATVPEHIAEQWEQWHLVERVTAKTK